MKCPLRTYIALGGVKSAPCMKTQCGIYALERKRCGLIMRG